MPVVMTSWGYIYIQEVSADARVEKNQVCSSPAFYEELKTPDISPELNPDCWWSIMMPEISLLLYIVNSAAMVRIFTVIWRF